MTGHRTLTLHENGPPVSADLTLSQVRELTATKIVEAAPGPGGQWLLRPTTYVGAAHISGVDIFIAPKVPVNNVLFLAGYRMHGWRSPGGMVAVDPQSSLVPALARLLWQNAEQALRAGPLHGYRTVEERGPTLRGRLRETAQLTRGFGAPTPLAVRYDEFSADIAENQLLLAAITRMHRVPGVDVESARRLRALAVRLAPVSVLPAGAPLPAWQPNRLNEHLQPALKLAELILAGCSVRPQPGNNPIRGFIINVAAVLEDFLAKELRRQLTVRHGGAVAKHRSDFLDCERQLTITPDITWTRQGRVLSVIDAKYKRHAPNDDVYQMLAYCTAHQLDIGHLVYVDGAPTGSNEIRACGIRIVRHVLTLDAEPDQLLRQVADLSTAIVSAAIPHS